MISRGGGPIKELVVMTSSDEPVLPCGVCLQVIGEFGRKSRIVAVNRKSTAFREAEFEELFPQSFSGKQLKG